MSGGYVAGKGGSGCSGRSDALPGLTGNIGTPVYGQTWLWNTCTGKVYRIYFGCADEEGQNGCKVSMPAFSADRLGDDLPSPAKDNLPGLER